MLHSIFANTSRPPPVTTTTTVTCFSSYSSSSSRWSSCSSINHHPISISRISINNIYNRNGYSNSNRRRLVVICMAKERRVKMVAKQIQRELSDMLLTDQVLQYAILPEAALGADRYLSSLTTITDVELSSDLQVVKVYVSVFGDERGKEVAISGLKSKAKYVRGQLGKRMKLRLTPEIRFIEDESLERGSRVIAILDKIKSEKQSEKQSEENLLGDQNGSSDPNDESEDWEDDDPDDDIIYVK